MTLNTSASENPRSRSSSTSSRVMFSASSATLRANRTTVASRRKPVPAQYMAGFDEVRDVSSSYFTLEELAGLRPDLLFASWNYGLRMDTSLSPAGLAKYGIKTLALTESRAHVQPGKNSVSIDDTYQDLRNLGAIFDMRNKAQQVISAMQAQVASVRGKIAGLRPVTVFDTTAARPRRSPAPG